MLCSRAVRGAVQQIPRFGE